MDRFDEEYLQVLEQIDELAEYAGDSDESVKSREIALLRLAQLKSVVETAAVDATAEPAISGSTDAFENIELARQKVELGYRRLRNAQIVAEHKRTERWHRQREELLRPTKRRRESEESTVDDEKSPLLSQGRGLTEFNPAVAKSEDITATLRRVHQMAQGEVLKGELNIEELDSSTKTLRELEHKYSAVDVLLNGSRRLVKVLEEADKGDRRRMQLALGFLAAVMGWIIYRRVLKLPLKILFWNLINVLRLGKWASKFLPKGKPAVSAVEPLKTALETLETYTQTLTDIQTIGETHTFRPPEFAETEVFSVAAGATQVTESDSTETNGSTESQSAQSKLPLSPENFDPDAFGADRAFNPENYDLEGFDFEAFQNRDKVDETPKVESEVDFTYEQESTGGESGILYHPIEEVDDPEHTPMPVTDTGTVYYAPHDTFIRDEL